MPVKKYSANHISGHHQVYNLKPDPALYKIWIQKLWKLYKTEQITYTFIT